MKRDDIAEEVEVIFVNDGSRNDSFAILRDQVCPKFAFAKRSAAMQAGIVDGVESSVHVGDRQSLAIHLKFANGPRWDLIFSRRTQKCHFSKPPVSIHSNGSPLGQNAHRGRA